MAKRSKRTDERQAKFLATLRETCSVSKAATAASIGRSTAYAWRASDEAFRAAWDEAEEEAADALEAEAWRRAVEGVDTPITYQGAVTANHSGQET